MAVFSKASIKCQGNILVIERPELDRLSGRLFAKLKIPLFSIPFTGYDMTQKIVMNRKGGRKEGGKDRTM